jgi:hypothetical protein
MNCFVTQQLPATPEPDCSRRLATDGLPGKMNERKMAAFLFARALHRAEEFLLASNVDGLEAFDDLVFRYRLKGSDVWKTSFVQLKEKQGTTKHEKKEVLIQFSSLIKMSGDFSLLKYFESFCHIKSNSSTHENLKHCGPFDDFQFVIYTNAKIEMNSDSQAEYSDPLNIFCSGTNCGMCITFNGAADKNVFKFFEKLSKYQDLLVRLDKMVVGGTRVGAEIDQKIESFRHSDTNKAIKGTLQGLKSNFSKDGVTRLIGEPEKCDFKLYKKVTIFRSQSNEIFLQELIKKELVEACKLSHSVAESIYTEFGKGLSKWWKLNKNVLWHRNNAQL